MKLPSKYISYNESVIFKFPIFLEKLKECDLTVNELYKKVRTTVDNIDEFVDVLVCLYSLGKIEMEENTIHYVKEH